MRSDHEIRPRVTDVLALRALGVNVRIRCEDADTRALLMAHFERMRQPLARADLTYTIGRPGGRLFLTRDDARQVAASDLGELLLLLDQDLIIQLQKRRPDLYFIHAGVLEFSSAAFMLVAPSGGGKSTTAWALVHHGFRYLSDELGPVDLQTVTVHPYPRALALKSRPPASYPLPRTTLSSSRGFHVATDAMSSGIRVTAAPLAAIFFLRYASDRGAPAVKPLSAAQAAARLYANVLNALAHPEDGLDGAIRIARTTACFELSTGDLTETCHLVEATLDGLRGR